MNNSITKYVLLLFLLIAQFTVAKCEIIYTDIEPDNVQTDPFDGKYFVDFDNNGSAELELRNFFADPENSYIEVYYKTKIYTINESPSTNKPASLNIGFTIGADNPNWFTNNMGMTNIDNFTNQGDRFLGVKFSIGGQWHYGWVRVNIAIQGTDGTLTVKDYAYESVSGTAIITGETGTNVNDENFSAIHISICPNPVEDYLNITLDRSLLSEEINIYNMLGEKVLSVEACDQSARTNISALPKGMYIVKIGDKTAKFVKN